MADDAVVELDAAARPWTAEGDVAELDRIVVIEKLRSAGLVVDRPDLAADLGEDLHAQEIVLQHDHLPGPGDGRDGIGVKTVVRVDVPVAVHRIRIRERIRRADGVYGLFA